ncbi:quinon protein alcohol dehydrogenase-like superfamily [Syncephalastrum racemosum]|uniref:Quinon protein alcohol dehydrogenase-like superfamily n=1 Tax=Syncephalastrum racemosum TaxID=13706 RepID=A0A1X2HF61_SYNRA|nr:quinon protein alcohol dehydrogenase-like superfamily [Syncephalastrum racemosum]
METHTISPVTHLRGHKAPVLCLRHAASTSLGNSVLASGSEDKTCRVWDLRQARAVKGIQNLDDAVSSVAFASGDANAPELYLAVGTKVLAYDLRNTSMILSENARSFEFSKDEINHIDINAKGTFLATADDEGEIKIVDLQSHKIHKKMYKKHANIAMSVAFHPQKSWEVWSGGLDCKLFTWDFSMGKLKNVFDTVIPDGGAMFNPPFVHSLTIGASCGTVAAGLGDGSLMLVTGAKAKQQVTRIPDAHTNLVNCLSFITRGRLLTGSANGQVGLWDTNTKSSEPLARYQLDSADLTRLNWLETYAVDDTQYVAAAGIGSSPEQGALCIYSIQQ